MVVRGAAVLLFLLHCVNGQIRVMAPEWLKKSVGEKGSIEGSTATFGAPFFGDDVVGRLVYGESKGNVHCTEEDYDIPDPETEERGDSKASVKMINIFLVRRGKCSFTTKVKTAYKKGAHAVIIIDREDSDLTTASLKNIIVGDDGYGDSIHIPSVLVAKQEGNELINAAKKSEVIVQLSWSVPANHIVEVDLWMNSGSKESQNFLKSFAPRRKKLNEVMSFTPHYSVFSMPSSDPSVYQELCSDTTGKYCAEDPDASGDITGRNVLDENVRQLCIHELTKVSTKSRQEAADAAVEAAEESSKQGNMRGSQKPAATSAVLFAEPYWNYLEKFPDLCPVDGTGDDTRFGYTCSKKVMEELGIDTMRVDKCVMETKDEKLKEQRDHQAWSPKALRINGWRYTGMLDADLVTRAVCAGFIQKPAECEALVSSRDPFAKFGGEIVVTEGVSFSTFLFGLLGVAAFSVGTFLCYKKSLKDQVHSSVREEVTLEVQSAMAAYNRLHNNDL